MTSRKFLWILLLPALSVSGSAQHWIGTWATAPQPFMPAALQTFRNQTLRLIVHTSAGGKRVRIRISNTYGDHPLVIGSAHIARRADAANIDPASDRAITFGGHASASLPDPTEAKTSHLLAKQTNYVATETGNFTGEANFPASKTIRSWPFLTGVDVEGSPGSAAIVAFGSSLTDGDGSTRDANRRWPDVLAERLQKEKHAEIGVLNEGNIGNRLLNDSPRRPDLPFGASLGQAGLARLERDVFTQPGVKYVVVGINDIAFPGSLTRATEFVTEKRLIAGYQQLIARAHRKKIRVIGTTNPPFEGAFLQSPPVTFFTPEKERVRVKVNDWIRTGGAFDAVVDLDRVVRDPDHPSRILPAYDSGDHIHPNDAGYVASANAVPLALFKQ